MNKKLCFIILLLIILLFVGGVFALPSIPSNIYQQKGYSDIINIYYKSSSIEKNIDFTYTIDKTGIINNKKYQYRDIIVGDITGLTPVVINNKPDKLLVNAKIENVFFLTTGYDKKQKECIDVLKEYYSAIPFSSAPYNINNKEIVIDNFLLPITKENIIDYLYNKNISSPEDCFINLLNKKILIEYPMLLTVKIELKGKETDFEKDFGFKIKFDPEFVNPAKPIQFKLKFRKESVVVKSIYSLPNKDCKTNMSAPFCYITISDIENSNQSQISSPSIEKTNNYIRSLLDNFNVVSGFKDMSFEDTNVKELLVHLALKRERFCFREDNKEYTKTIFDVAKAYNLSLEQTFQLWAIISERSNCNYQVNPNLYGFAQISLKDRDSGNLIEIDSKLPLQLAEEEQFQYLALGNFTEINNYLYEVEYNKNKSKYYNLGYNGIINNDHGYFGFLINAIKNNKDEYGSTILFTSDYLKELNFLVKNSREKSSNPYVFDNFIIVTPSNINNLYTLSNLFGEEDISKKEQIYLLGDYPELFKVSSFFLKENNYIKTTKEIRVLINYLAIKRKYLENSEYFSDFNVFNQIKNTAHDQKLKKYEKLDANYWNTKKEKYLKTLSENNWSLILKDEKRNYNYDFLIKVNGQKNMCAKYVREFGQKIYIGGENRYPNTGANAWTYDTSSGAINAFNVVWEAKDICNNKNKCNSVPTSKDCCYETKSVQYEKNYNYYDLFIDGAIIGVYIPNSSYNSKNREYTHVIIHIGKTIYGTPLIAESVGSGQSIKILDKNLKNRIKRIYVPKSTNIKDIKDIVKIQSNYPSTYVLMSSKKLQELIRNKESKGDTEYNYEEEDYLGEENLEDY
jgi:hypothetical protein